MNRFGNQKRLAGRSPSKLRRWRASVPRAIGPRAPGSTPQSAADRSAFSLMEIMLAVAILALLITSVYATWSAAMRGWKHGTAVTEAFQRQRIVMETLAALTESAVYFNSRPDLYEVRATQGAGEGQTLSFVTASPVLLPPNERVLRGLRRVTLALRNDPLRGPYLALANAAALTDTENAGDPVWHTISSDVVAFVVRFRNPRDGGWYDRWEEPDLIPSAFEFTVAFRADDPRSPPLVVTRAMELPAAAYVLAARGQQMNTQNTTNTVTRQNVDLSSDANRSDTGTKDGM